MTKSNPINHLTLSQIKQIANRTPKELEGRQMIHFVEELGYFHPFGANWCYRAGWTDEGILVVTRYGSIVTEI